MMSCRIFQILTEDIMSEEKIELELEEEEGGPFLTKLSEEERKYAEEFSERINPANTVMILQYGSAAQKKISDFTDSGLRSLPNNDLSEITEDLGKLISSLEKFDNDYDKKDQLKKSFKALYDKAESKVRETARRMELHRSSLLRHITMLDKSYASCMNIVREFDMYILAGKLCLQKSRSTTLPQLIKAAEQSQLRQDTLTASDFKDGCDRLERKLYDLGVSRELPVQTCMQIRAVQNSDAVMAENLRNLNTNVFPLWKERMMLALGLTGKPDDVDPSVFHQTNEILITALKNIVQIHENGMKDREKTLKVLENK